MTLHASPAGHGGHRADRRRRLLSEDLSAKAGAGDQETPQAPVPSRRSSSGKHRSENYGDAAFLESQLRLTDLAPRRVLTVIVMVKAGIAAIAGLVALHLAAARLPAAAGLSGMRTLGEPGSFGNWFSSLVLLLACFWAVVGYSVRRHKTDDYRGHYRVWLWAAVCWFLMATEVATGLHREFQTAMIDLTHKNLAGDGAVWWLVPAVLLVGGTALRLLIDMRASRTASAALVLSMGGYAVALIASQHVIRLKTELADALLVQGSLLASHLLLAWSMGLHARHVLLDAEGRLPRRASKPKRKAERPAKPRSKPERAEAAKANAAQTKGTEAASNGDRKWHAVDPPHGVPQPAMNRSGAAAGPLAAAVAQRAAASSQDAASDESKMNKADRKAMKKKLLDERLRSEQRKASNW